MNTMEGIQVISETKIHASSHNNHDTAHKIDLTPWDLQFFPIEGIQKGLLFSNQNHTPNQIQHLKHSLSSTLAFFPPLAGRLAILQHPDNTVSSHIDCNNAGVSFVHAVALNTTVSDILQPNYVPRIVHSFFPLNGVKNYQSTSQPVLAVQVTELVDGIFIAISINHVVADGRSFWHFVNSWAEISRGSPKISKLPSLQRCFLNGIHRPVRFPFTIDEQKKHTQNPNPPTPPMERFFHFTKEKIAQLKSKANAEANTDKISSLQALLTLLWRSVTRCQQIEPREEVRYVLSVGARPRMVPPLGEEYFGNAAMVACVRMKAGELLDGGVGKGASEINKVISLYSHDWIKNDYECWVRTPKLFRFGSSLPDSNALAISSSPRFNVYGNDFGWGKPVGVRSGGANKRIGKFTVFAGPEEGSIDVEVCLPYEVLEAMDNDRELMDVVTK
ncbi:hypothetical protein Fmac_014740 [Flemingia macrophylla]|uniref:HXXXD-type acyl-transferase family protein n=1 Tax=Flemingia macrophylla TaxID=520843 RepID=A0ABD1MD37_9FABA